MRNQVTHQTAPPHYTVTRLHPNEEDVFNVLLNMLQVGERTADITNILEGVKAGDTVRIPGQVHQVTVPVKVVESDAITPTI